MGTLFNMIVIQTNIFEKLVLTDIITITMTSKFKHTELHVEATKLSKNPGPSPRLKTSNMFTA